MPYTGLKTWVAATGVAVAMTTLLSAAPRPAAADSNVAGTPMMVAQAQEAPRSDTAAQDVAPPPPPADTETVENPYGLGALWAAGDVVSRGTLVLLLLMSMGSWYILFTKLYEQYRLFQHARSAKGAFRKTGSPGQSLEGLAQGSPFHYIAEQGVQAADEYDSARAEQIDRNSLIAMSIQRALENVQSRLQDGLSFLATVGSTAPFVGLFGTVWGIYHALTAIGIAGQASIDKVAGPVGEALIMTAMGLAVAVPAVMAYNWLVRRNKRAMEELRAFSAEVHLALMSGRAASEDTERVSRLHGRER